MRKIILSLLIVSILLTGGYLFYNFKINNIAKENTKTFDFKDLDAQKKFLKVSDLNPKSFIILFKKKYNKDSPFHFVSIMGDFPNNWVKPNDVQYLMSIMHSKEKCCGYMNVYSSTLLTEDAEVGGFAIIFLNSYISKTKINLGSNSNPKTDKESIEKIKNWYHNTINKN
jgi:hypothetical protein